MQRFRFPHLIFVVLIARMAAGADATLEEDVDGVFKQAGISEATPGAAVLVVQNDEVLLKKGYGLANLKDRVPINCETTFEIASTSKTFTGIAICLLQDQGKLKIDDPVRKYVPELPANDPKNPIRILNLLQHTSGLSDYLGWPDPKGRHGKHVDNEDYVHLLAEQPSLGKPQFPVGSKFNYSNTNFLLLAVIAARIAEKPFGTFMHQEVFKPLGMKQTWIYDRPGSHRKNAAKESSALSYIQNDKGKWEVSRGCPPLRDEPLLTCGDGAVWTSIDDMILWDKAIRGGRFLKPETWSMAVKPSSLTDGTTYEYGFGWGLWCDKKLEVKAFGHNGKFSGFRSCYWHYTPLWRKDGFDLTVVVLSNRGDFGAGGAADEIYDVVYRLNRSNAKHTK